MLITKDEEVEGGEAVLRGCSLLFVTLFIFLIFLSKYYKSEQKFPDNVVVIKAIYHKNGCSNYHVVVEDTNTQKRFEMYAGDFYPLVGEHWLTNKLVFIKKVTNDDR